jgi:hypothetical protein
MASAMVANGSWLATLLATNLSHPIGMNETADRPFGKTNARKTNARKLASTEQLASFL